jgi:hypothetical protein
VRNSLLSLIVFIGVGTALGDDFQLSGWAVTSESTSVHVQDATGKYIVLKQGERNTNGFALISLNSKEGSCMVSWNGRAMTLYIGDRFATPKIAFEYSPDHMPVGDHSGAAHKSISAVQLVPLLREVRNWPADQQSQKMEPLVSTYGAGNVHGVLSSSNTSEPPDPSHQPLDLTTQRTLPNSREAVLERMESPVANQQSNLLLSSILNSRVPEVGELVGNADDIRALNDLKRSLPEGGTRDRVELQIRGYAAPSIDVYHLR